jgi:hypothetical protein
MPAGWSFIMADKTYEPLGEVLNAYDRKVAIPLNKLDTCSFRVRLDNPLSADLMSAARYIKAYRDDVLTFFGPIVTAEETGDASGASVVINCVGGGWILQKRFVGKTTTGTSFVTTDRASIMGTLIDTLNAEAETGIGLAVGNAASSTVTYTTGPYKQAYEALTDLSAGVLGFDWRVLPNENWDFTTSSVSSAKIGAFYARPVIGSVAPEAIFEWGGGRSNVSGYTRTVSRDGQADRVFHIAAPGPDVPGYPVISSQDLTAQAEFGLVEDIAQGDLLDAGMRQQLTDQHIAVRANPRHIIQFTPHIDPQRSGRLPNYGQHYTVGDQVRVRVMYQDDPRVDSLVRVWGVSFEIQNDGTEKSALVLAQE